MAALVLCLLSICVAAQGAQTLAQVKKVYVESFGDDKGAAEIRDRVIKRLRQHGGLQVVDDPQAADAVLKGTGQIWVSGYISNDVRSPGNNRQAIYRGFLAVELIGKNNEPLWSYLVTPGKFVTGPVTDDLAGRMVAKLIDAAGRKPDEASAALLADAAGQSSLRGSGATFPAPLYQRWLTTFQQQHPSVHITYDAIGSEGGIQALAAKKADFAASDFPLSDQRMAQLPVKVLHFPTVLGAVVPIYNIKGVGRSLRFTPQVLAGIYLGKITKWNDPQIQQLNRGVHLPDGDIVVVHRSDGSGTTYVWTDYLSKVSPEWNSAVGASSLPQWPRGQGANGNEGVALMVRQTANSIGYVEWVYALQHELSFGAVRNAAGKFIAADIASVTAAAEKSAASMSVDFRVSITNAEGGNAYPIATFTWLLVPKEWTDARTKTAMQQFLQWALTTGQKECSSLGYAPLPREITERELQYLAKALE